MNSEDCQLFSGTSARGEESVDGASSSEEAEEEISLLEGAIAQCLFLRYGLDMDYRDDSWGGHVLVSHTLRNA